MEWNELLWFDSSAPCDVSVSYRDRITTWRSPLAVTGVEMWDGVICVLYRPSRCTTGNRTGNLPEAICFIKSSEKVNEQIIRKTNRRTTKNGKVELPFPHISMPNTPMAGHNRKSHSLLVCWSICKGENSCFRDFRGKKTFLDHWLCPDTCEPSHPKLGMILEAAEFYSLTPVWMTMTFTQGHRVRGEARTRAIILDLVLRWHEVA